MTGIASLTLALCACACPPPPTVAPVPQPVAEHHDSDHDHHRDHHGKSEGPLVHRFDEGGEYWKAKFEEPGRDASQKPAVVIEAMMITEGMTVADIGAGTGYFMQHLSPAVGASGRVLAIDIEPTMVRFMIDRAAAEGFANVDPRLGLTDDPLLKAGSVSRILIVNTWHHVAEREAYANKLQRALTADGAVFIVDFNMTTTRGPAKDHRLPAATVVTELESAGFTVSLDEALLPDQYVVTARK